MKTKSPLILLAILVIVVILIAVVASDMQKNGIRPSPNGTTASSTVSSTGSSPAPSQASSTPAAPDTIVSDTVTITQADNGTTVTVKKGSRFLLKLGEEQWDISISDPSVIARVPNIMVVRGAQGIYNVLKTGTTKLTAQGRPFCQAGQMCAQYIIQFSVTIKAI